MDRKLSQVVSAACGLLVACGYGSLAFAQDAVQKRVPAKLICGSHSANPQQHKAFQVDLQFDVNGSLWMLDWKTERAEVKFRGILSPSGAMLIAGLGRTMKGRPGRMSFPVTKIRQASQCSKGVRNPSNPRECVRVL